MAVLLHKAVLVNFPMATTVPLIGEIIKGLSPLGDNNPDCVEKSL